MGEGQSGKGIYHLTLVSLDVHVMDPPIIMVLVDAIDAYYLVTRSLA